MSKSFLSCDKITKEVNQELNKKRNDDDQPDRHIPNRCLSTLFPIQKGINPITLSMKESVCLSISALVLRSMNHKSKEHVQDNGGQDG